MPITPTNPIQIAAKTYDRYWLSYLHVSAPKPGEDPSATIKLIPYNSTTGDSDVSLEVTLVVPGVFAAIAKGDRDLNTIMSRILAYAEKEAKRQHLIN
jgi:hypothetical protein